MQTRNLNITSLPVTDEKGIRVLGITPSKDVVHVDLDESVEARVQKLIEECKPLKMDNIKDLEAFAARADKVENDLKNVKKQLTSLKKTFEELQAAFNEREKEIPAEATEIE